MFLFEYDCECYVFSQIFRYLFVENKNRSFRFSVTSFRQTYWCVFFFLVPFQNFARKTKQNADEKLNSIRLYRVLLLNFRRRKKGITTSPGPYCVTSRTRHRITLSARFIFHFVSHVLRAREHTKLFLACVTNPLHRLSRTR